MSKTISFQVSEREKKILENLCEKTGNSTSAYLRWLIYRNGLERRDPLALEIKAENEKARMDEDEILRKADVSLIDKG